MTEGTLTVNALHGVSARVDEFATKAAYGINFSAPSGSACSWMR